MKYDNSLHERTKRKIMRRKIKKRQGVRGKGRWSRTETTLTQLYLMQIASDFSFFLFPVLSLTLSLCLLSSRVLCGRQSIRKKSFGKTNSGSNRQKKIKKRKEENSSREKPCENAATKFGDVSHKLRCLSG